MDKRNAYRHKPKKEVVIDDFVPSGNPADLAKPIEVLELSEATYTALKAGKINTLSDLASRRVVQMYKIQNVGKKNCFEISKKMSKYNLAFRPEDITEVSAVIAGQTATPNTPITTNAIPRQGGASAANVNNARQQNANLPKGDRTNVQQRPVTNGNVNATDNNARQLNSNSPRTDLNNRNVNSRDFNRDNRQGGNNNYNGNNNNNNNGNVSVNGRDFNRDCRQGGSGSGNYNSNNNGNNNGNNNSNGRDFNRDNRQGGSGSGNYNSNNSNGRDFNRDNRQGGNSNYNVNNNNNNNGNNNSNNGFSGQNKQPQFSKSIMTNYSQEERNAFCNTNRGLNDSLTKQYVGLSISEIIMGKRPRPAVEPPAREVLTSDSIVKFCRKGKWGYKDWKGNVLIQPIYDEAYSFSEGMACVERNGKVGFIDGKGTLIVDYIYDTATSFSEGFASVTKEEKSGYIDKDGKLIIDFIYEIATPFNDGRAIIFLDGRWGVLGKDLKIMWR